MLPQPNTAGLSDSDTITLDIENGPLIYPAGDSSTDLNGTYTENSGAVLETASALISEFNSDNLNQLVISLTNPQDGSDENISLSGRNSADTVNGITITYDSSTQITLSGTASAANYQALLRELQYQNIKEDIDLTDRIITIIGKDENNYTGVTSSVTLSINGVNDEPTLSVTGSDPAFTEDGSAVGLFSSASINTVESGQNVSQIVVTVTNVNNGASEKIIIDGTSVALTDGTNGTTTTNSFAYSVSVTGTTANGNYY